MKILFIITIFKCIAINTALSDILKEDVPENAKLNFTELAIKYTLTVEEYDVTTEDGYILKVFHVVGNSREPVIVMPGIADSSDSFLIRGNRSLIYTLAKQRFDIWTGNVRGNKYSKKHMTLDSKDRDFWNFTFHEHGLYDLPAIIDFVLLKTGQQHITAIGHSQGNTIFYVLCSLKTEYNKKIKLLIALAPIAFLNDLPQPDGTIIYLGPLLVLLKPFGVEEVLSNDSQSRQTLQDICSTKFINDIICGSGLTFITGGADPSEIETEFTPVIYGHFPAGTSRKNLVHFSQVGVRERFAQLDYGLFNNLIIYNAPSPPDYDLNKVTINVALLVGKSDNLSTIQNVKILKEKLPRVVLYEEIEPSTWVHGDFLWARNMDKFMFPQILQLLNKYIRNTY